jgi:hypothetical protein
MPDAAAKQGASAAAIETQESSLLDQIVEQGRFGTEVTAREHFS